MTQFPSIRAPSNVLIDSFAGTGAVYSFDPVGSYEREACRAAGAAQSLVQPFLDNQVSSRSFQTKNRFSAAFSFCLHLFLDLLQKSDTCTWNVFPQASAVTHCAIPRNRFVHWCNRTTH